MNTLLTSEHNTACHRLTLTPDSTSAKEAPQSSIRLVLFNKKHHAEIPNISLYSSYLDLYVVPFIVSFKEENVGHYFMLTKSRLNKYHLSENSVWTKAFDNLRNTEYHITPFSEYFKDIADDELPSHALLSDAPELYLLHNSNKLFAADALFRTDLFENFSQKYGCNVYILPCSKHELILVKDDASITASDLLQMVKNINYTSVSAMDFLSDNIYYYRKGSNKIQLIEQPM